MNSTAADLQELKDHAKRGDLQALQKLRNRGFFRKSPDGRRGFATSHGQQRLWVLHELDDASVAYNMPLALMIVGDLNRSALRESLRAIVNRHESLRTTFAMQDNEIRQFVHEKINFDLEFVNLSDTVNSEHAARQQAQHEANTPFDLHMGPLLRAKLLELAADRSVLLLNIHHIVSDEWSLGVLGRELEALYRAFSNDQECPLPPPRIQYKDYAAWHEKQLTGEQGEAARQYWLSKLSQPLEILQIPTDYTRPLLKTFAGRTKRLPFQRALIDRLLDVGRRQDASLFMLLTALVKVLLYRYTGQRDITIGSVVSGRDHPDLEQQIGFYVNTLAIRDYIDSSDRFSDVLVKVKQTVEEAFEHQIYPIDKLIDELGCQWDPSRSPLFDVMIVLQYADPTEFNLEGVQCSAFDCGFSAAKFDLTFALLETVEGAEIEFTYNADLLCASTINQMAGHLEALLEAVVSDPSRRIADVEILSSSERRKLFSLGAGETHQFPDNTGIHQLVEEQVERTPGAVAVMFEDQHLTYAELNARANQLAHHLIERGVGPEVLVGICVERSLEMVVGLLGILKAGGAYVPLDPEYPRERLTFMLDDAQLSVLLTQKKLADRLPSPVATVVYLDADWPRIGRHGTQNPTQENRREPLVPDNLAYVIYTSGSTGKPKGVLVQHSGLVNLAKAQIKSFDVRHQSRVLQFASLCFDASISEICMALCSGARLCLAGQENLMPGKPLEELADRMAITHVTLPPTALEAMSPNSLSTCTTLIVAGDVCSKELVDRWSNNRRFIDAYGPTETTVCATISDDLNPGQQVTIGRPIPNTDIYILDEQGRPTPINVPGELHIGGVSLARGYLNRPDLTAEKFVANPFSEDANSRLYKTGDLARYLTDGNIQFLGRLDHQLKIRGFRIEPGEIESTLSQHPEVREAVVVARDDHRGDKCLIGYVAPRHYQELFSGDGIPIEAETPSRELIHHLQETLPAYMVPSSFIFIESLPLTPTGKVDRRALPEPDWPADPLAGSYLSPRDATEELLAEIWSQVLDVKRVGIHDSFFELGGHSLKAVRIISRIHSEIGIRIGLAELFQAATVAELAAVVRGKTPTARDSIPALPESNHYEVSIAQRRLWLIDRMGAEKTAYSIPSAHLLRQRLDVAALEQALDLLISRHESLRTTFLEIDGEPRQRIQPYARFTLELHDLRQEAAGEERARALALREANTPFDLEQGPLIRTALYQIADDRFLFFLNMHHIISDGWSIEVLMAELLELYEAFANGREAALPALAVQYKDYAAWQNKQLAGSTENRDRQYWLDRMSGEVPVLDLPADLPRPAVQTFRGDIVSLLIDTTTAQRLKEIGAAHRASPFMVLLSLVQILLHRYSGQEDIIVGFPVTGRGHLDLERQVGFFVNMLALRNRIRGADCFFDVLKNVRLAVSRDLDHQAYPFDRLVEELGLQRDMSRSPLFDVAVAMEDAVQTPRRDSPAATSVPLEVGISKFDLTFFFSEAPDGGYNVAIEYSTDLFLRDRIERMGEHLRQLAESVLREPTDRVADLNILPRWERDKVVRGFNETARSYPSDRTIAGLFEEQVAKLSDAPAVACGDAVLSYRELNQLANDVAHCLIDENGLRHEECVGVLLDRSQWAIVALLGILKAGGAYVPIDPANPSQRIAHILRDANCRVALCDAKGIGTLREALPDISPIDISTIPWTTRSNPPASASSVSLAYVMYTSGSTGAAKGTLVEQKSVLRLVLNTNYVSISPGDCILQTGSLGFDASTFEIWGALLNGACVCLRDSETLLEANELGEVIKRYGITTMFLTTGLFNQLAEADACIFEPLKTLLTGGEKVSVKHFNLLREKFPALALGHVYGPTENTTFSTWFPVRNLYEHDVPIGAPIANSTIHILDNRGLPVPVGVPGEICAGGDGLARGYLRQPALTAEKFVPHPCIPGARVYRTGDQGRWEADGTVTFIGRLDNQIKVRGYRVEPGEIESRLLSHASVNEAVVIAFETTVGTKELVAYTAGDGSVSDAELRSFVGEALPEYMVPAYFVRMAQLPLNVNGKIDRAVLPAPNKTADYEYAPPRSVQEEVLCEIWQSVLGRDRIGIVDNYFELGGDSIRAIQLVSRLRRGGWELLVRDLFEHPTIESLAPKLRRLQHRPTSSSQPVIGPVPLTAVQRWFFQEHVGVLHHFNQAVLLRAKKRLDEKWMCQVLSKLQEHHDALRMKFLSVDSQVRQINVGLEQRLGFAVVDLRDESFERAALENHANGVQSGIDLQHGPLMKAVLYRMSQSDRLLLVCHHLVVDGVSWRILLEDLAHAYAQCCAGKPIEFGDQSTSFQSWAQEVVAFAESQELLEELPYWSEAGSRANLQRELDQPSPVNRYGDTDAVTLELSAEETNQLLTDSHHAYHTQINDLLLTALGRALTAWNGSRATWITMEGHGREPLNDEMDLRRTVGWFTSLYPFQLDIPDTDIGGQIKYLKESLRRVPRKGLGYGILRYVTPRKLTHHVVFNSCPQISFNYLGKIDEGNEDGLFVFAEESSGQLIAAELPRQHELDFVGLVVGGRLQISLTFSPTRHSRNAIDRLMDNFKSQLRAVIDHCARQQKSEKTLSDFSGVSADDYESILKQLNNDAGN